MCRVFIPILLVVLLLPACKGEDDRSTNGAGQAVQQPSGEIVINGRVSIGATKGATVRIFPITGGVVDRQQIIGSAVTDSLGFFSLRLPRKYDREPALVEVSLSNVPLKCILVAGCAFNVPFAGIIEGGLSPPPLRLMVPNLSEATDYQVSLLSELASSAALADLAGIATTSINGMGTIEAQFVIAKANTRVASRFGLVADLPSARVFDITSNEELLVADSQAIFSTVLESALLAECAMLSSVGDYIEGMQACADQYNSRGIPGRSNSEEREVSMVQTLAAMVDVFEYLESLERDFSVEKSEVLTLHGVTLSQDPGEYSKGVASENINFPLVEKGKRFVENVRQIASSLNLTKVVALTNLSGFVNGEAAIALEDFGVNINASELLEGDKPTRALHALYAIMLHSADKVGAYYDLSTGFDSTAMDAQHDFFNGEHHLFFDQYIRVCESPDGSCDVKVDMHVTIALDSLGGNALVNRLNVEQLKLKVEGTISQEGYELRLEPDSASVIDFLEFRKGSGAEEGITLIELVGAKLKMPLTIRSYNGALSHLLKGVVAVDATHFLATFQRDSEELIADGMLHKNKKTMINIYSLAALNSNMSGKITTETGDDFYAAINILQGKEAFEGLLEYTSVSHQQCHALNECEDTGGESAFIGELEDSFVDLAASVSYKADLQGVREPVELQLSGYRTSPTESAINSLKITYPGHALHMNGQFNNKGGITSMSANNLDGIRMSIDSQPAGKRYGAVSGPGGDKVGDVIDMGEWIMIRYPDGNFVSM